MEVNKYIGIKIADKRSELGLSQQNLADYIGLTRCQLSNIERGKHGTTHECIWNICNALHLHPTDLFPPVKFVKFKTVTVDRTITVKKNIKVKKRTL